MAPPRKNPTGSSDATLNNIAAAMQAQAATTNQILQHLQQITTEGIRGNPGNERNRQRDRNETKEVNGWSEFLKTRPPTFVGGYEPVTAERWLVELEKIFKILNCIDEQKVNFAAYMLQEEAEYWWRGASELLSHQGREVTWHIFRETFLDKYFPRSVRAEKEIEFLQLRQNNRTVEQYIAKFEELSKFSDYMRHNPNESWKAIKFEAGLNPEIHNAVVGFEIREFVPLINKCRLLEKSLKTVEEDRERRVQWKRKREFPMVDRNFRGKAVMRGKQPTLVGPRPFPQRQVTDPCGKCGRYHKNGSCYFDSITCFQCGQKGHIAQQCPQGKGKGIAQPQRAPGRVFTLSGAEAKSTPGLMQDERK